MEEDNILASPQINNITFHLPPTPFFYQPNKIPKVFIKFIDKNQI